MLTTNFKYHSFSTWAACAIASPQSDTFGQNTANNRKVLLPVDHSQNICPLIISVVINSGHQIPSPVTG